MIVVCSACQARFKVADEKVGPRGAKVRCSKCQTVFVVHRDPGGSPDVPQAAPTPARRAPGGLDLDLEPGPRAGFRPSGVAADPFGQGPSEPADPFGNAGSSGGSGAQDPFAAHDPFSSAPGGFGSVDPFVAQVSAPAELPAATPPPEPSGILDTGFDFDTSADAAPQLHDDLAPRPNHAAQEPEPDLALDERTPARPLPAAPAPGFGGFGGEDSFEDQSGGLQLGGSTGFGEGAEESFAHPHEAAIHPPAADGDAARGLRPAPEAAAPAPAPEEDEDAIVDVHRRASRFRAIAVNAISLVALLAVAIAFLSYWRGVRPGMLLRPAAVLGAIGAPPEPFSATQLRSGLYERSDAPPILFVTGKAVSHAGSAVAGLRVRVEVVRGGAVLARGEAGAGVVPTAEELYASRDAAGLVAAAESRAAGRHKGVKPGEAVPFLVAISDYPPDVVGAGLHVTVEPIEPGGAKQP